VEIPAAVPKPPLRVVLDAERGFLDVKFRHLTLRAFLP
jgi:hypothetical protein